MVGAANIDSGPVRAPRANSSAGSNPARGRHDVARAGHQVRNGVHAGAVRHRRGVDDGVLRRHGVDVDEVARAHRHQVAVRQHHALGAAGGATGVEQPRQVAQTPFGHGYGQRIGCWRQQRVGVGRIQRDLALQPGQRRGRHVGRHKGPARAAVGNDPFHLTRVQLGIDGHGHQPCPPQAPQHFKVTRVVVGEQQHAVALGQAGGAQLPRQAGAARGPVEVAGVQPLAMQDGGGIGPAAGLAGEQVGQGHGGFRGGVGSQAG
jgi:hypothetical protein